MPDAVTHPTPHELAAFARGKLSEAPAAAVAAHLKTCAACRQSVESLPPDPFAGKIRAARPGGTALPPAPPRPNAAPASALRPPAAPPPDLPPELANHPKFRIVRELGKGGMGVVYEAVQRLMDRKVALKVISPAVLAHPEALARFQAEARAAGKLDHPHIARAYDADQAGNLHFLVMEFVEGVSLAQLVGQRGPLAVAHACHYVRQAALGLQHALERGMVHRDVKPSNLMVSPRGVVKVLDFGLARLRTERARGGGLTQADSFMGTPEYVAPEQATDAHSADIRSDVYSLGCTLYFLLAGRPPFEEGTAVKLVLAHIEKEPTPLHEVRPDVPAGLSAVVARMLAKDPARRYQTPVEVAQALAAFVRPGARREAGATPPPPPEAGSPSRGTVIGGDTRKLSGLRAVAGGKGPAGGAPAKDETANPFEELGEPPAPPTKAKIARPAAKPVPVAAPVRAPWYRRWPVLAGTGAVVLALLAGIIITAMTADGEAVLVVEVDQPGAEVVVDGGERAVAVPGDNKPVEIRVKPGQHKFVISKDGFVSETRDIQLKAGKSAIKVRLKPVPAAYVVLEVDQAGAEVLIDGQKVNVNVPGDNQRVEIKVKPGRHTVEVRKDGFETKTSEIELKAGEAEPIQVTLVRRPDKREDSGRTVADRETPSGEKEPAPTKPEAPPPADEPAKPKPEDTDPINANLDRARASYRDAREAARAKLLAAFEGKRKELLEKKSPNLAAVNRLNKEKEAFEANEKLPASREMIPAKAEYQKALRAARKAMEEALSKARQEYAREGQTGKAEAILRELKEFQATVVATAIHLVTVGRSTTRRQIKFYSNNRIDSPTGDATWTRKGNLLILRWPDPSAPGGAWVDECVLYPAGYRGRNQKGVVISGQWTGGRLTNK